ncbi:hypothetical protein O7608_31020 [Solwaraspora sp. WMMA2056]|uniref:hypothetical protein n=1 Tax=Solwaraspora sp. WMMA2056 TaxID=3015161 RepID=UPI00259AF1AE|nr:hypothetical protein [Solwaraspora sp. WMMA2056]WJK40759.1 hypothetical protein O7608_31020 [Solwaraspora sp. WMMA2056]
MVADEMSEAGIVEDSPDLTVADVREAARPSADSGPTGQRTLTARAAGRSGRDDISERVEELLRNEIGGPASRDREACTGELGGEPDDSGSDSGRAARQSERFAADPAQARGAPDRTEEVPDGRG